MQIGIIGCSGHYRYVLDELKNHTLVGICRGFDEEDMRPLTDALNKRGIVADELNLHQLFELKPDIVVVNTRFDLNSEYTAKCLERNIYVFSEKPLALEYEAIDVIKKSVKNTFVSAMFGINYEPWFLTLKSAVDKIGDIRMINARKSYTIRTRPDFFRSRDTFGGIIPWVAIHALYWIYDATGLRYKSVSALSDNSYSFGYGDLETSSACLFEMENGAIATVTADYFRPDSAHSHDDDRLRIVGTKGIVEYQQGKVTLIDIDSEKELKLCDKQDIFKLFIERVKGSNVGVSFEESVYITEIALKSRESADLKTKIYFNFNR